MNNIHRHPSLSCSLFLFLILASIPANAGAPNPFTAKAAALRYWSRKIPLSAALPRPDFFVSKLSPLAALDTATYSSLSATNPLSLSSHLPAFCTAARILCGPVLTPSLVSLASHRSDVNFTTYSTATAPENFTSYGAHHAGGLDSFTNYLPDLDGLIPNTFRSYSRDGAGHDTSFGTYFGDTVNLNFTSYASGATGGDSGFTNYERGTNVPNLKFTNYATNSNGHTPTFTSYSDENNAGQQSFAGYGKDGNAVPTTFTSYATDSNVVGSTFNGYGESGSGDIDSFKEYGNNSNGPEMNFGNYGKKGNGKPPMRTA